MFHYPGDDFNSGGSSVTSHSFSTVQIENVFIDVALQGDQQPALPQRDPFTAILDVPLRGEARLGRRLAAL